MLIMGDPAVPTTPAEARIVKVYESDSIEEVDSLVKQAIRSICLSGCLQAIQIARVLKKYEVKFVFDNPGRRNIEEFDKENFILQQRLGPEDYQGTINERLYTNKDVMPRVKVLAASVGVISLPAVIKRYYCAYPSSVNKCLKEVLLQTRLASFYTCRLLDFSIRRGEKCLVEVELVMERLQGDLKADIQQRIQENNPYTETELIRILECMAEALFFAKLRVRTT